MQADPGIRWFFFRQRTPGGLGVNKRNRGYPADFEFVERPLSFLLLVRSDRRRDFQAGLSPPSSVIPAFCALGNRMFLGKIKGIGRDLLVGARLTLIDKPDGGSRPIRIECACRR